MPDTKAYATQEYVDTNFELRDRALKIEETARKDALTLATAQLEGRLEKLNKLRDNVLTKIEFEGFEKDTNRRIETMEKWQAKLLGIGIVLALISAIIGAGIMRMFSSR